MKLLNKAIQWASDKGYVETVLKEIDHVGIKRKLIHGSEMRYVLNHVEPGDLILTLAYGEATSLLIEGDFSHATLVSGINRIIDSRADGIRQRDILDVFPGTCNLWVGRPKLSVSQITQMLYTAEAYAALKIPYDYRFGANDVALYCSEFYWTLFNSVAPNLILLKERMGKMTVTPQDLYESNCFETIFSYDRRDK